MTIPSISRREFLGTAAAFGLSSGLAQRTASSNRKGLIDVHHHIGPPAAAGRGGAEGWTAAKAIEEMDRNGIAAGVGYLGPVQNTTTARQFNDFGAQLGRDYPGRFGLFAALPMADVDGFNNLKLPANVRRGIERENAEALLPRWKSSRAAPIARVLPQHCGRLQGKNVSSGAKI